MKDDHYTEPKGYGAYTPNSLVDHLQNGPRRFHGHVRPLPYYSFTERLAQAWDVFRYRADALYWKEPKPKSTKATLSEQQ